MLETLLVPCSQTRLTQENHRFFKQLFFFFLSNCNKKTRQKQVETFENLDVEYFPGYFLCS